MSGPRGRLTLPNDVACVASAKCVAIGASQSSHVRHDSVLPVERVGGTGISRAFPHYLSTRVDVVSSTGIAPKGSQIPSTGSCVKIEMRTSTFAGLERVFPETARKRENGNGEDKRSSVRHVQLRL